MLRRVVALFSLAALAALVSIPFASACPPKTDHAADVTVKPYQLVRISAKNVDPKAALIWRVNPSKDVSRATSPRGVLEFVAPPGVYTVELLVIKNDADGGLTVEEESITVEIESPGDRKPPAPNPPAPEPKQPDPKKPDPANALGRITFGTAGCTATVIGPRRADGRWDVLTAAHCVTRAGQRGVMMTKGGQKLNLTVVSLHTDPDCAWLVTDETPADLPFAIIAEKNPALGAKVWHSGYGVDKPGNREDGEITGVEDANGQLKMSLSVSSGDSGGGIFRADTGELVSCVCCTTHKGAKAHVWGCSAEVARRLRPGASSDGWAPAKMPKREPCSPVPLTLSRKGLAEWLTK